MRSIAGGVVVDGDGEERAVVGGEGGEGEAEEGEGEGGVRERGGGLVWKKIYFFVSQTHKMERREGKGDWLGERNILFL